MKQLVQFYFEDLNASGVRYCHWKSNNTLDEALDGIGDLDLLVDPAHEGLFSSLTMKWGFKIADDRDGSGNPFVYHYYALDEDSGALIHLHVYFKLVTGGAILKNHHIPLEELFLSETSVYKGIVPIPHKEVDLLLFVLRKMCEQPVLVEHLLFWKDLKHIHRELDWLVADYDPEKLNSYLQDYLPQVPLGLFNHCLDLLVNRAPWHKRIMPGFAMHRCFPCTVVSPLKALWFRNTHFAELYIRGKLKRFKSDRVFFPGGKIIAFVGSEASGKSTLSSEIASWLGQNFDVKHVHMGKPPKSLCTKPIWWVIKLYVTLKKPFTSNAKKAPSTSPKSSIDSIAANYEPHPVAAWLDSIDRASMVKRMFKDMMRGSVIVTDRYPSTDHGGLDGPRIPKSGLWGKLLHNSEYKHYARLPHPDIVIKAMAPLKTTQERNAARDDPEPEDFVAMRYEKARNIHFPSHVSLHEIETSKPLEICISDVKKLIWTHR